MAWRILVFVAVYFIFLFAMVGRADFMDLQEVSVDYKNFRMMNPDARNPLVWPESPKEGLDFSVDFNLFWGLGFIAAKVESLTTTAQFREVGLEHRIGAHLSRWVDVDLYHLSQHVLDEPQPTMSSYPYEDGLELKVYLYRR